MDKRWRKLERKPLFQSEPLGEPISRDGLMRILPHRDPMLLLDRITGIDLEGQTARGEYVVDPEDPIFAGHFPGLPIYPGVLQAEAIGQLGLCVEWFVRNQRTTTQADDSPSPRRVTRIHHARFLGPVQPGDTMEIHASLLEVDVIAGTAAGQIYVDGSLRSVAAFEVYFDD